MVLLSCGSWTGSAVAADGVAAAGQVGDQVEGLRLVASNGQAGETPTGPGGPALLDARDRSDQRAVVVVLIGHRLDRLLLAAGPPQLLDPRRLIREAAAGHRLTVVVVRRAAHSADVHRRQRLHGVDRALDV